MALKTPREIWRRTRHQGPLRLAGGFDYVVAEKLMTFAGVAATRPEFARELPRFVSEVRRLFTPGELRTEIARIEREHAESPAGPPEEDDVFTAVSAQERQRFAIIGELLTASELGTV